MSNRRKIKPPTRHTTMLIGDLDASALAADYRCGHCNSQVGPAALGADGVTHIAILHDDGCPVLTGALTAIPDTMRAIRRRS